MNNEADALVVRDAVAMVTHRQADWSAVDRHSGDIKRSLWPDRPGVGELAARLANTFLPDAVHGEATDSGRLSLSIADIPYERSHAIAWAATAIIEHHGLGPVSVRFSTDIAGEPHPRTLDNCVIFCAAGKIPEKHFSSEWVSERAEQMAAETEAPAPPSRRRNRLSP